MLSLHRAILPIPGVLYALPGGAASAAGGSKFLAQAMQDSLAEIESCELALQKTSNDDIKVFSQRMIDQHSDLGREIEQLASEKNAELPKDVSPERQSELDELSRLSGTEFDEKFIEYNMKDHEKDVQLFREQADQAEDDDIKAFAEKGARMLAKHLNMARDVDKKLHS